MKVCKKMIKKVFEGLDCSLEYSFADTFQSNNIDKLICLSLFSTSNFYFDSSVSSILNRRIVRK